MKLKMFLMAMMLCSVSMIMAQRTVTGTVTDDLGEALIGATVQVVGFESSGAITDIDGTYSISVPDGGTELVFSYTGYSDQTVALGSSNVVDASMSESAGILDEVVIIGYSAQQRKNLTGAVSSVTPPSDVPSLNMQQSLQGAAAGVTVSKNGGTPGGGVDVRVRGTTSITASSQPLYVIDGVPAVAGNFSQIGVGGASTNALADINPDEIESIEVIKDAATAAIYGSRAANGVVLITTKKGKAGKTSISLNSSIGTATLPNQIPVVSGPQYQDYLVEVFTAFGLDYDGLAGIFGLGSANNNWQDEVFRDAALQEHSISLQGGSQDTRFYASLGYADEEGIMKSSGFERYSARLNLNHIVSEKVGFDMNIGYTYSNTDRIQNDNNIFGALSTAVLLPPVVEIRNDDGSWGTAFGLENPVAAVTDYDNNLFRNRVYGKIAGNWNIFDELVFTASLGIDVVGARENEFQPSTLQSSSNGTITESNTQFTRFINEYLLKYGTNFGKSSLNVVLGTAFQEDKQNNSLSVVNDLPTNSFSGLSSGASPTTISGAFTGSNLQSYFGNLNYSFDNKYIVSATLRADGSSRFVNDKFGIFPGVSAAWRISEESFFNKGGFMSDLKLRVGWGNTGNNAIGNFTSRQLFAGGANYLDSPGIVPTQLGNPDLKWESTTSIDAGIDFGFFDGDVTLGINYYKKNTEDLLLNRPIPTTSGFTTVLQNVGEVENTGVEVELGTTNVNKGGFFWSTSFNIAYNKNEVLKLVDDIPFDAGFATRIAVGQPVGSFFGHVTDGIFQNQAEIDAHATQPNAAPGDIRFKDISGGAGPDGIVGTDDDLAPDGIINDNDRAYVGSAIPDITGGLSNTLSYKGFDLNFFFQFALGHEIYNNNLAFAEGLNSVFAPTVRAWEGRWQNEGDVTNIPRLVRNDPNGNRRDSNRFAESGDYLRLKTLTFGYTIPKSVLGNSGIERIRLYVAGQNLLTITDYSWFDPEVNIFDGSNTALGTDFLTFPQARSISFGLNVGF